VLLGCVGYFLVTDTAQVELKSGRVSAPALSAYIMELFWLDSMEQRCKLNLKAEVESSISHFSFKR